MDIPQELRDRVQVVDHGVVEDVDPDTGDVLTYYATSFLVMHEGLEHGLMLSSSPTLRDREHPGVYEAMLQSGIAAVLAKAGLIP